MSRLISNPNPNLLEIAMIYGFKKEDTIFNKLNNLDTTLYLTGSRFFGGATADSDYDFFTSNDLGLKNTLKDLEFEKIDDAVYPDQDNICLMRYSKDVQIDIQIIHHPVHKLFAQNDLIDVGMRHIPKMYRPKIWDLSLDKARLYYKHYKGSYDDSAIESREIIAKRTTEVLKGLI